MGRAWRSTLIGWCAVPMLMAVTLGPSPALAVSAEAGTADIVVTATRRPSRIVDVPVALSALDGPALQLSGVTDVRGLDQLSPSLLVSTTGTEANAVARLRGVGTVGDNPGLESSVALFIDGVYRPRIGAGLSELGEVERVELLRGPQATLYGRNSNAGLIAVFTRAPQFHLGASGEAGFGDHDGWRLAARVTGPVAPGLAASLEGVRVRRGGLLALTTAGGAPAGSSNDRDRYLLRGQLLFAPDDVFSLRLIADYSRRDEHCCGAVYVDVTEETGTSPAGAVTSASNRIVGLLNALAPGGVPSAPHPFARHAVITPGRDYISTGEDWGVSAEAVWHSAGGTRLTSLTAYRDYRSADSGDYDYTAADLLYRAPGTERRFRTFSQELRAQGTALGQRLDWLVGGYYAREQLHLVDDIVFGSDYGRYAVCRLLLGTDPSPRPLPLGNCASLAGTQALINAAVPAPLRGAFSALAGMPGGSGDRNASYGQRSETLALFTHNIVHLTSRISLTAGLRYTREVKRLSAAFDNNNATCTALQTQLGANPANFAIPAVQGVLALACLGNSGTTLNRLALADRMTDDGFSGTAALSWKPTERLMLYVAYARGQKAGGYNLDRFQLGNSGIAPAIAPVPYFTPRSNTDAATLRFAPESVDAFELGVKYRGRRFSAGVAAYRQLFHNFQLNTFNGTSFIVQTINGCGVALAANGACPGGAVEAGLVSQGVELEANATPLAHVDISGGLAWTDARYADRLVGSSDGRVPLDPALFLLPGNRNSNAPEVVATASLAWTPPIGGRGLSALLYVDTRVTSGYNSGSDLAPEKYQRGYALVNARIGLRGPGQRWAVELWAQNLFDQDYVQLTFSTPLQGSGPANQSVAQLGQGSTVMTNQLYSAYLGDPRTWGLTLKGKF